MEAKQKLKDFARAWEARAMEFKANEDYGHAGGALLLAAGARTKAIALNKLLEEDKMLDKAYDAMKEERKRLYS